MIGKKSTESGFAQSANFPSSLFVKKAGEKGFAISIDALLATVLTIGVISFIGFGMQAGNEAVKPAEMGIKQAVDDTFTVLENNGVVAAKLVDESGSDSAQSILDAAQKLIPKNAGLHLEIKEFEANLEATSTCKTAKTFDACFTEILGSLTAGEDIPADREVFHGRIISMKKSLGLDETGIDCEILTLEEKEKEKKAMLDEEEPEKAITTEVIVTDASGDPITSLNCDQEARVTLKMKDDTRSPIAVALVMDKSASMSAFDMSQGNVLQNPPAISGIGKCGGQVCGSGDPCVLPGGEYTNWVEIGSFTVDSDLLISLANSGIGVGLSGIEIRVNVNTAGECSNVPRIRVMDQALNYYPSINGQDTNLFVPKERLDDSPGIWKIYAWSDIALNANVSIIVETGYHDAGTGWITGSGTADYSGGECTNYQNWQEIGTFNVNDPSTYQIYGRFEYSNYAGGCDFLGVKVLSPDGTTWFDPEYLHCPKPKNDWCVSDKINFAGMPTGNYEIWAWSDYAMGYISRYYLYKNKGNIIKPISGVAIGTCNNLPCDSTVVKCGSYDGYQPMGVFSIPAEDNLRGLYFKLNTGTGTYSGKCSSVKARLSNSAYTHNADYYSGCSSDGKCEFCVNERQGFTCIDPLNGLVTDAMPVTTGDWKLEVWSDKSSTNAWNLEMLYQRIDAAKKAAKNFIDNIEFDSLDKLGLVSFSDLAEVNNELTIEFGSVKDGLNELVPEGQTGLANALIQATNMFGSGEAEQAKFIVLLTDGMANVCRAGTLPCNESIAADQAIEEADKARAEDKDITIYVIGFADPTIAGGIYANTLKAVAKDSDDPIYCTDGENCGKYYYAANTTELEKMYDRVVGEIRESFGTPTITVPFPDGMNLVNEGTPGKSGEWDDELNDGTGGWTDKPDNPKDLVWAPETRELSAAGNAISYTQDNLWLAMQFDVKLPCNGSYCSLDYVMFPPEDPPEYTTITDSIDLVPLPWPEFLESGVRVPCTDTTEACEDNYLKMPFKFKDIGINFYDGDIVGGNILLDLNVANKGYLETDLTLGTPLKINFLRQDRTSVASVLCSVGETCTLEPSKANKDLGTEALNGLVVPTPVPANVKLYGDPTPLTLCASKPDASGCIYGENNDTETIIHDIAIPISEKGTLIAEIDPSLPQCSGNDIARIYCGKQKFRFFTIDYYSWVK